LLQMNMRSTQENQERTDVRKGLLGFVRMFVARNLRHCTSSNSHSLPVGSPVHR
jgi:hypothetical protein